MADISKIKVGNIIYDIKDGLDDIYIVDYSDEGVTQTGKWAYIKWSNKRFFCFTKSQTTFGGITTINSYSKWSSSYVSTVLTSYPVIFKNKPRVRAEMIGSNHDSNEDLILVETSTPKQTPPKVYLNRNFLGDTTTSSIVKYGLHVEGWAE